MKSENAVLLKHVVVTLSAGLMAGGIAATRLDFNDPFCILLIAGIGIAAAMLVGALISRS